jgi:hypothetical protein
MLLRIFVLCCRRRRRGLAQLQALTPPSFQNLVLVFCFLFLSLFLLAC